MRTRVCTLQQRQTGIGLIEIMVAMVISLVLMNGVIQVFYNSKRSYNMTENLSRMQESARFAMSLLAEDARMAGFMPCRRPTNFVNTINGGTTDMMLNFFGAPLMGYEGGVSAFPAGFPVAGTSAGNRIANSDALVIISGGSESYNIVNHNGPSAQFKLTATHTLQDGDIVLACNNINSAIFQVTNVNPNNQTVVHNQGTGTPGNCTKSLGGTGDCTNQAGITAYSYDDNSQLVKVESFAYFIGISSAGNTSSLYRRRLLSGGSTQIEELLEGIESIQILYGWDNDSDSIADRYTTADAITAANAWNNITSIRIGLLVATPEEVHYQNDTNIYNVAGTLIGTAGPVTHAPDKRLRYVFSSTIKLRNR